MSRSFAFVHAEDGLGDARFALPPHSRIMQTGGYKGRSREVAPEALRAALAARHAVPTPYIVAEYGMTELSSQMYETTLRAALAAAGGRESPLPRASTGEDRGRAGEGVRHVRHRLPENLPATALGQPVPPRRLWVPGWVRVRAVDPERLTPLPDGELGVLRIDERSATMSRRSSRSSSRTATTTRTASPATSWTRGTRSCRRANSLSDLEAIVPGRIGVTLQSAWPEQHRRPIEVEAGYAFQLFATDLRQNRNRHGGFLGVNVLAGDFWLGESWRARIVLRGAGEVYGMQAHPGDGGGGQFGIGFEVAQFTGSADERGQGPRLLGVIAGEWGFGAEIVGGAYSVAGAEYGLVAFAFTVRWPGLAGVAIIPLSGSF